MIHYRARLLWAQAEAASAADMLQEALAIAVDGPHLPYELRVRAELAQLAAELGRPAEAEPHLSRCRAILAGGEDWRGLAGFAARAEGAVAAAEGRIDEARGHMERALATFRAYTLVWEEADALVAWGAGLLAAGERATAEAKLDAALALYRAHGAGEQWAARVLALKALGSAATLPALRDQEPE